MLDPHSSLFPGSNTSSEVPGQPISCVELTGQLLAPARPPDLHGLAYLAVPVTLLTGLLCRRPGIEKVLPVGAPWRA